MERTAVSSLPNLVVKLARGFTCTLRYVNKCLDP